MKKFLLSCFCVAMAMSNASSFAQTYDLEGYPEVYLRGSFNQTGWACKENYKFHREGNVYTLQITAANPLTAGSDFKIGDKDWHDVDFGASDENTNIDRTQTLNLVRSGKNLHAPSALSEATISFSYAQDLRNLLVNFYVPGTDPAPTPGLSGTLPVLYINVYADEQHTVFNNDVIDRNLAHKNYFEFAEYWLDVNGCQWLIDLGAKSIGSAEEPLALQIKARGNYTRTAFAKKPFKLKLDKKQSLLGMTKSKHYAILAHADDDKGYLRNFTGFNLGKRIGLPWTPTHQPVEVVINGDYRGLYFLTESIRVDEDRVNIVELADNEIEGKLISGGYIVELDNYDEENQIRMDEKSCVNNQYLDKLRITFDTPEEYSDIQRRFVTDQFTSMNNYVGANDDRLWSYLDLDDAARYYLVEEIVGHTESFHGSTYLFRDYGDNQKWHFSPLWDFGNAFNSNSRDFFYNCDPFGNTWIPSMRQNATFNNKVQETWLWFMSNRYDGLVEDIDTYVGHLVEAAKADHERWKSAPVPNGGISVTNNSDMTSKRNSVVNYLKERVDWLKTQFGNFSTGIYSEPERDKTAAAPLPDYAVTGVEKVMLDYSEASAPEYYNLQGIRVSTPSNGIYIRRQGTRTEKVVIK